MPDEANDARRGPPMSSGPPDRPTGMTTKSALLPIVDQSTWERELAALRAREKAATRELDAIAAQRRRQEEWQDVRDGWPQSPTYSRWAPSESFARYAEED